MKVAHPGPAQCAQFSKETMALAPLCLIPNCDSLEAASVAASSTSIKQHPETCFSSHLFLAEISALKESRAVHFREATWYRVNYGREGNRGCLATLQAIYSKTLPGNWNQAREAGTQAPSNKRRRSEEGQDNCQLSPLLLDKRRKRGGRKAGCHNSHHYDAVQFSPSVCSFSLHTSGTAGTEESGCWFAI